MESVKLTTREPMRDPMGIKSYYDSKEFSCLTGPNGEFEMPPARDSVPWSSTVLSNYESAAICDVLERLIFLYGRGDSFVHLIRRVHIDLSFMEEVTAASRQRFADYYQKPLDTSAGFLDGVNRKRSFSYCAIVLLLLPDGPEFKRFVNLIPTGVDTRSQAFDVMLKAFLPNWRFAKKYPRKDYYKYDLAWADPFVSALAAPTEKRTQALALYTKNWNRIMKDWGYKPSRDEMDSPFHHFAFETALAVCSYDLDDSSFRDHPYYPRVLVDYYRENIRHTRDAWRAHGVGPGVPIESPPLPKKIDLMKSKSKGLSRWVELVSDGDKDATDAVLEQVGKLRKVKDVNELSCALAEHDAGFHADLKDDDTLTSQINTLLAKRQLEFELPVAGPDDYAAGVGRCADVLLALDEWLCDRPYRLLALDTQDDSWQAVLVPRVQGDEFEQLSAALGIGLVAPQDAFDI